MSEFINSTAVFAVLDKIVAYLFIILFFWGATNKFGKKDEFNDDFTSLEVMKSLRGIAAVGVMIHHISQEYFFQEAGVLSAFVNAGAYFVAIFFFCSGYGLIKSLDSKKDYLKGFIRKRIVRAIVVPFYVNVLVYGILMLIVKWEFDKTQWVTNFLGLTMMNRYAWFPIVLALLYLVFYLCFRFIKNRHVCFVIIFLFMVAMGMLFCVEGHYAWWYGPKNWWMNDNYWETSMKWWQNEQIFWFNGEWWVNSAPAFLTGLIFATYEKKITGFFKKSYALKFHILLVITVLLYGLSEFAQNKWGYWSEWNGNGPAIGDKIITFFFQTPLLATVPLTVFILMMKYHVKNPVFAFFGKYSLHTYLMNLAAITLMRFVEVPAFFDYGNGNLFIYAIAVLAISTYAGVKEQQLTEVIQRFLFRDKKKAAVAYNTRFGLLDDVDTTVQSGDKTIAAPVSEKKEDPSVKAPDAEDKTPEKKDPAEKKDVSPEKKNTTAAVKPASDKKPAPDKKSAPVTKKAPSGSNSNSNNKNSGKKKNGSKKKGGSKK